MSPRSHGLSWCVLSALLIAAVSGCADTQSASTSACQDCVALDTVATLDFSREDFYPSPRGTLVADAERTTFAFVDRQVGTKITLFGPDTVHVVGGEGDGPGEYRDIDDVWFDAQGRLGVLDRSRGRIRRYDSDLGLSSEQLLDFRAYAPSALADGRILVVAVHSRDSMNVGYLTEDDALEPVSFPDFDEPGLVLTTSDLESTVWIVEPNSFRIWRTSPGGQPELITGAAPEWFGESYGPGIVDRMNEIGADTDGATALMLTYDHRSDLLWAVFGVPSSDFTVDQLDRMLAGEVDLASDFTDHVVVALSPDDGTILGSRRFDYLELMPGDTYQYVLGAPDELFGRYPRLAGTS